MLRRIRQPKYVATLAVLLAAVVLFVLATEPFFGPTNRFRVIMLAILLDTMAVIWLLAKYFELLAELRSQHRAATHVSTVRGMVEVLEAANLPHATRQKIYAAMAEQFDLYDLAIAANRS